MSGEELKPCPFCGGKADIWKKQYPNGYIDGVWKTRTTWVADCSVCDCVCSEIFKTKKEAIEAWNRRVEDDK